MAAKRLTLGLCAAMILGSLAICLRTYAIDGGGGYSSIFGTLIFLAALTTVLAATAGVNAWRFGRGWLIAATVVASVLASALILFIGAAIELRG